MESITQNISYCSQCGKKIDNPLLKKNTHIRNICTNCDAVYYDSPKIIVASLVECNNKVLLGKRAIEPRQGYWALPGGYMECNETVEEAARRETKEETNVDVDELHLYALFNCPKINQVYFVFRGSVSTEKTLVTPEFNEVKFFNECEIPWENLSYSIMKQVLDWYYFDKTEGRYRFRTYNTYESCPE